MEVGDLLADALFHGVRIQGEVDQDAAHVLALEGESIARGCTDLATGQVTVNQSLRLVEVPCIDQRDGAGDIGAFLRSGRYPGHTH